MRTLACTVLLLTCTACMVPAGSTQPQPGSAPAPTDASLRTLSRDVLEEVNRTREKNGRPSMQEDAALMIAAREHSEELAERRRLDHTSIDPERRTMTMRIEAAGGTWIRAAENLANLSGPPSRVPREAARMWMTSDGHRANMMNAEYTHTGVGIAVDERGYFYVTQLYAVPRPDH